MRDLLSVREGANTDEERPSREGLKLSLDLDWSIITPTHSPWNQKARLLHCQPFILELSDLLESSAESSLIERWWLPSVSPQGSCGGDRGPWHRAY